MKKAYPLILLMFITLGCSESKRNYLNEGEKLLRTSEGDKSKVKKAIELFKSELHVNPSSGSAAKNLAFAYSNVGKNDSAIIIFTQTIEENKREMADLYQGRGMIFFILKNYDASIEDFESAIKYNGGNQQIFSQIVLSKLWKSYNKDGEWLDFTEDDISKIIDEVYPEDVYKPTVKEFQ